MTSGRLRPIDDTSHAPTMAFARGDSKTIGRSSQADVVIDHASLSRLHARVTMSASGEMQVEDLGSTNGVFVNDAQRGTVPLSAGDRVRFGQVEYRVDDAGAPSAVLDLGQTFTRVPVAPIESVDSAALAGLLATSRELMAFSDLPTLLDRVLDRLQPIVQPDRSAILLFDAATGELTPRAVRPAGAYKSVSEFASSTLVREAIRSREIVEARDAALDARLQDAMSIARAGVRSALCVPLLGRSGPIGALYADRLVAAATFTPAQVQVASAFAAHAAAAIETAALYDDRERHFRATLESLARALESRDRYTAGHSERVTAYTLILARAVGVPDAELETIRRAGMLHDVGKVGVPDRVLLKPGPLDPDERTMMEAHVTLGYDMLQPLPFLTHELPIIRGHHERWDGTGYPDGCAGEAIHGHARLMAVGDSYDAMTSARPYRNALPAEEAARRVRKACGTQFDPRAVEAFDRCLDQFEALRARATRVEPHE